MPHKKQIQFLFLFGIFGTHIASAEAQLVARPKSECNRRCFKSSAPPDLREQHEKKLKELLDKKDAEVDPVKRKELEAAVINENDRFDDEHKKACEDICQFNPEK